MSYFDKYQKYKTKYLKLRSDLKHENDYFIQKGGDIITIHKENNGKKYWAVKKLPFISHNDSNKKETKDELLSENVYFILEQLEESNFVFWSSFIENQYENQRGAISSSGERIPTIDGITSFQESLRLFRIKQTYDIWVAYVTTKENVQKDSSGYDDIEMCFTLLCNETSPITTHMGITRNYKYFGYYDRIKVHKNLAINLHGFSAKCSCLMYPKSKKIYMVTRPATVMRDILKHELGKYAKINNVPLENIITIGDNEQRLENLKLQQNLDHDMKYVSTLTNESALQALSNIKSMDDTERKKLLDKYEKFVQNCDNFLKELTNENMCRLLNMYNDDSSQYLEDIIKVFNSESEYFEDYCRTHQTIDDLINKIKNMKNDFVLHRIKLFLKSVSGTINFHTQGFFPENLNTLSPLDNTNNTTWAVLDGKEYLKFSRPDWFDHRDLHNWLPSAIIKIDHLSNLFNQ